MPHVTATPPEKTWTASGNYPLSTGKITMTDTNENLRHHQSRYSRDDDLVTGFAKWKLLISIGTVLFILMALYAAVLMVLLPLQIQNYDPVNKIKVLGIILMITSVFSTLATPLAGALSDRTKTRFGRRNPWIATGGILGGAAIAMVPLAGGISTVVLTWLFAVVTLNAMQATLTVIVADRFAPDVRGLASGISGGAMMGGLSFGTYLAGKLASDINFTYYIFGCAISLACLLFVLLNKEKSSIDNEFEKMSLRDFAKSFWINPRTHPDFAWAFFGRFVLFIGYCTVSGYLLYILQDYFELSKSQATEAIANMSLITLAGQVIAGVGCGVLSDLIGRRKPLILAAGATLALAVAVPLFMPNTTGLYTYAVLLGIGYGAFMSVDLALMTQVLPKQNEGKDSGKDLGILTISVTIPQIISPVIGAGILMSTANDYRFLFMFAAVFALVGAAMILPIRSVK